MGPLALVDDHDAVGIECYLFLFVGVLVLCALLDLDGAFMEVELLLVQVVLQQQVVIVLLQWLQFFLHLSPRPPLGLLLPLLVTRTLLFLLLRLPSLLLHCLFVLLPLPLLPSLHLQSVRKHLHMLTRHHLFDFFPTVALGQLNQEVP